ncbi:MAG: hypothetical protein IMZ62_04690 [Chloroflexi bacterium]|nr:hypothetical protein [Chloroflexota bacterium]
MNRDIHIHIEKPRLAFPVSLEVDDGVPCINPLHYYYLQVIPEKFQEHEHCIPFDLMEQFAEMVQRRGMRGKFTVLPYPAGLGSILDGWEGCDRREMEHWLELARSVIAPQFDITPEILTHTLALDLHTHQLIPEAEHIWMADRTQAELAEYMSTAVDLLRQAGFAPTGITQPVFFKGNRAAYDQAVLESIRPNGGDPRSSPSQFEGSEGDPQGLVTFYFVDFSLGDPPVPPHPVVLLDREKGEAVVNILDYADDFFWHTQYPSDISGAQRADKLITADGQAGRLVELMRSGAWATFVTHWQSLYSNGSRQGLAGLDEVAERLARTFGSRLMWVTNSQIARYRAAEEACQFTPLGNRAIQLDSAFGCPDFTLTLQYPKKRVPSPDFAEERVKRVELATPSGAVQTLAPDPGAGDNLISPAAWRQAPGLEGQVGDRITVCFDLKRGIQVLRLC